MKEYKKPLIDVVREAAEGVYANSGTVVRAKRCGSIHMQGIWQGPDNSDWNATGVEIKRGYKQQFGCEGCRAYTETGCGYAEGNHYDESGQATSYDSDPLEVLRPTWEQKGYGPDDIVTDWL